MWHSDDDTNNVMYVVVYKNVTEFVHSRLLLDVSFDYCEANLFVCPCKVVVQSCTRLYMCMYMYVATISSV